MQAEKTNTDPTAEDILAVDDRNMDVVNCPEWGCVVHVRTITADERDRWEKRFVEDAIAKRKRKQNVRDPYRHFRASFVQVCACRANGDPLFTTDQIPALSAKSAKVVDRIYEAARDLNGMSDEDADQLVGNLESDPQDD